MKRANTMSTITVELIIKMKTKFTSSNAEKINGFISPQMSSFHSMAPAMRAVAQVVNAVIQGVFAPDVTRSGRFLKPPPKDNSTANDGENSDGSYEFPFSDDDRVGGDTDATATDSSDAGSTSSETVNDATTLWELLRPELRPALVWLPLL